MKSKNTLLIALITYLAVAACVFGATFIWILYSASRSSGDNLGAGPIGVAAVVLFGWSLIAIQYVRRTAQQWARLTEAVRAFRCLLVFLIFVLPTAFFGWFSIYLMIGYFKR